MLFLIRRYALNLICIDDWFVAVRLVQSAQKGALTWHELFAPYYDHRILFPRLATLLMWRMGFALRDLPAMALDWALFCGIGAIMLAGFHGEAQANKRQLSLWYGLPVMLWVFSPYLVGFFNAGPHTAFQWTFMLTGVVSSMVLLNASRGFDAWMVLAALAGGFASFSNAAGLMAWPVGFAAKTLSEYWKDRRLIRAQTIAWAALGTIVWAVYFHGWHASGAEAFRGGLRGEVLYAVSHPVRLARNFTLYWGIPFAVGQFPLAASLLAGSAALFRLAWRKGTLHDNSMWLFFWLFTAAVALETAVGRAWLDTSELQSGTGFYVVALLGLIGTYYLSLSVFPRARTVLAIAFGFLSLLPVRLVIVEWKANRFILNTMSYTLRNYRSQSDWGLQRSWIYCPTDEATAQMVRSLAPVLEDGHLNVFSEPPAPEPAEGPRIGGDGLGKIEELNGKPYSSDKPAVVAPGEGVELMGWAVDPHAQQAASAVYISIDGKRDVYASYGQRRRDVAGETRMRKAVYVGWLASFIPEQLEIPPGRHTVSLKIVAAVGKGYYKTPVLASFELLPPTRVAKKS